MTTLSPDGQHEAAPPPAPARLAIGAVQGAALLALYLADARGVWPATAPGLYAPLVLIFAWLPVAALGGVGRMRWRVLVVWLAVAAVFLGVMGWWSAVYGARPDWRADNLPAPITFLASAAALFVAHHLILAADQARRALAPYPVYFDAAWKSGVQLALSAAFTVAFWILLHLGAGLFSLIGVDAVRELIERKWFAIPATAMAFAVAVHLTDVRDGLIRGVRTVALMLLSWLMPVMTGIVAAFILTLPFTGIGRLWDAGYGTALMLSAAAALIILINAAYQDGALDGAPHRVLRWAARAAGVLLFPLIALALWGIALRIGQHGLTPDRIVALACTLVGAVYAGGYAFAAVRPAPWMKPLERTNVAAAGLSVVVILALFTPLADPARLSVNDQMRRLQAGAVAAEQFDYAFLRFDGGRAGLVALERLAASQNPVASARAREALDAENRYELSAPSTPDDPPRELAVTPHPADAVLPENFLALLRRPEFRHDCQPENDCVAALRDLDGDGETEILVADDTRIRVFARREGTWTALGQYSVGLCGESRRHAQEALTDDPAFEPAPMPSLRMGDRRLVFVWDRTCHPAPLNRSSPPSS